MKYLIALSVIFITSCYNAGIQYDTLEQAENSVKNMRPGSYKIKGPVQGYDGTYNVYIVKTKM
jgi:hypothetical protein